MDPDPKHLFKLPVPLIGIPVNVRRTQYPNQLEEVTRLGIKLLAPQCHGLQLLYAFSIVLMSTQRINKTADAV